MKSFFKKLLGTEQQFYDPAATSAAVAAPTVDVGASPASAADLYPADVPFDDGPCASCDAPCSSHPQIPDWLPIDWDSQMAGTVKAYHRHAVFLWGTASSWEPHIDKNPSSVSAQIGAGAKAASEKLGVRILVSAAQPPEPSIAPSWLDPSLGTEDAGVQVLLLPEMRLIGPLRAEQASSAIQAYYEGQPLPAGLTLIDLRSAPSTNTATTSSPTSAIIGSSIASQAADSGSNNIAQVGSTSANAGAALTAGAAGSAADAAGVATANAGLPAFVLVCAHKRRDKRCGVAGPLLVEEFRKEVDRQGLSGKVHTLAVSHIGGHAFAGNCIVYPDGTWYGRVKTCNVSVIVERHILGHKVLKELWRGRMQPADNASW